MLMHKKIKKKMSIYKIINVFAFLWADYLHKEGDLNFYFLYSSKS